jgi:UDP-N-acetylglucosamine--N-acetylmuramyl-(pentapeptide) pyrophosphoryl-undecaprenol N-acetylglucosamine transferase
MRMLIAGGGTGGHLFPGVALAEELLSRAQGHQVLFVGTRRGVEARAVPRAGFELELIEVGALKGKGLLGWLKGLLRIPRALWQSRRILRAFQPDLVVGVGGYASGPVVLMASLMRLPTAVMEQNALPGMTNRLLGSLRFFKEGKAVVLGNPVRKALVDNFLNSRAPGDGQGLLVFGGSQGAATLNRVVPEAVALLHPRFPGLRVVHQTGERELETVRQRYLERGLAAEVQPFIHDMATAYRHADVVVARAGATTVAELSLCRKAAVLIPFPFAADNHQEINAAALVESGAALMLREGELDAARLAEAVAGILSDAARRASMEEAAGRVSRPESAWEICEACLELAKGSRNARKEHA